MGRGDDYLWAGLKGTPNHPDRLLVGGLLGPRRGGGGGEQWAEPRWSLEETGKGGEGSGFFL